MYVYVCVCVCMYVCMYVCIASKSKLYVCVYVCVCVYMYVYKASLSSPYRTYSFYEMYWSNSNAYSSGHSTWSYNNYC